MRDDVHGRDGNQEKASKEFGFAHYQATPSGYPVDHSPHQRGRVFLLLPFLLWLFQSSLTSPETFAVVKGVVAHPLAKIVLLGLIWFYMHHFCAGIRYLLLDLHKGVELEAARLSSKVVFVVSIALTLIIGAKVLW
jgi:succinate dehydrogenase / fumarate reductase cytochrome b subunit